ncbi:MAG: putative porin [Methylococcaceae bacterium]
MDKKKPLLALALLCAAGLTQAGEKEELLKLRNTTTNLIKQLVKQGILTDKTANEMIKQAEADADQQVAEAKSAAPKEAASKEVVPADEVRVSYVPDFVKDEIRQQVRSELREEVVSDVMQKAKKEQWGMPNALPEWIKRFKLSGDMRIREQSSFYASDNQANSYFDWPTINASGGLGVTPPANQFLDTTNDRHQARERVRLGIDVNVAEGLDAGIRLATGNIRNPVSTNQTLGNTGARYEFTLDRAYLKYNMVDDSKFNWLTVMGGRTPNPFFTAGSELVWDEDLSFEGASGTVRHRLGESGLSDVSGGKGPSVFATAGIFPLQASAGVSTRDKWLFGGQAGLDWGFDNQDALKVGVGYFDYRNIQAVINKTPSATCYENTAEMSQSVPQFMQLGNSLTSICNNTANTLGGLVGLASNYRILNITALYDLALFAPTHLRFSADYAKNLGFNQQSIQAYTGQNITPETTAWQVKADVGWSKIDAFGKWSVFGYYKYLERDAVLDAYTDSDFHLGGTNTKGWVVGGNYGLVKNVWLTGRWLSGNVITGPQYGVDVMQLDLNTRF